jgi:hypothetical protein
MIGKIRMKTFLKHKLRLGGAIGCLMLVVLLIVLGLSEGEVTPTPAGPPEVAVVAVEQKDVLVYGGWEGFCGHTAEQAAHGAGGGKIVLEGAPNQALWGSREQGVQS